MFKKQHFSLKHWVQKIFSHMYALWHFVKCVSRLAPCKKSPVWLKNWASNDSSKLHPSKKFLLQKFKIFSFCTVFHTFSLLHIESASYAEQMYIGFYLRQLAPEHDFFRIKIIGHFSHFWKCCKSDIFYSNLLKFCMQHSLVNNNLFF